MSELLQRRAPAEGCAEGLAVQLRSAASGNVLGDADLLPLLQSFQDLCEDYAQLEDQLRAPLRHHVPPPYDIGSLVPEVAAEDVAAAERRRLGLGDGPLLKLRELLENDVGLRMFHLDLPPAVAGIFAFTADLGGCIAVNSRHSPERRRLSLAHEYGQFLTDRLHASILVIDRYQRRPAGERFAEAFSRAFLMPPEGLRRRFLDLQRQRGGAPTYGDLCRLAHFFAVSLEAMTRRLEDLRLIPAGVWERLRQEGFRAQEARQLLGLAPADAEDGLLPTRFVTLAVEAWQCGQLSEGQLARMLRTDRLGAREAIERVQPSLEGEDGARFLPRRGAPHADWWLAHLR